MDSLGPLTFPRALGLVLIEITLWCSAAVDEPKEHEAHTDSCQQYLTTKIVKEPCDISTLSRFY